MVSPKTSANIYKGWELGDCTNQFLKQTFINHFHTGPFWGGTEMYDDDEKQNHLE